MPATLTLLLLTATTPSVNDIIKWLPVDTETLLVDRRPGKMKTFPHLAIPISQQVRFLPMLMLPYDTLVKPGFSYHFVVDASRGYTYGMALQEGCLIFGLKPEEFRRLQERFKKSELRPMSGVYEVIEERRQGTKSTWQVALTDGLMICSTNKNFFSEVMKRKVNGGAGRALPTSLPEWKYIDRQAPFWVLRHFTPESNRAKHDLNLLDPKLIGFAMTLDRHGKQMRLVNLTRDDNGIKAAKRLWGPDASSIRMLDKTTAEFLFEGIPKRRGGFMIFLTVAMGRPLSP